VVVLCRAGSPLMERQDGGFPQEAIRGGLDMNPQAVCGYIQALRRHRSQVVITMTQKDPRIAGLAAKFLRIPLVMRHPMDVPFRRLLRHRFYYGWLPTHLIANSVATRRTMLDSATWLRPADVSVIYNGIPLDQTDGPPADLGLPMGATTVGFIGRFEVRKGILDLANAWSRIAESAPRAHLVLVGSGGGREQEVRERLEPSERVHWFGFRHDIRAIMRALDIVVVPSHYEGFCLVLAEAMAAGTAVVATRATNFPELVDDGVEGILFEKGNAKALADAVITLACDREMRARMGIAGCRRVRIDFSVGRMLDNYERVLEAVVSSSSRN